MMIKRSEGGLVLSLNRDFYSRKAVDSAIRDFSRACQASRLEKGKHHLVSFSGLETEELEGVALEFANYTLSLMKAGK